MEWEVLWRSSVAFTVTTNLGSTLVDFPGIWSDSWRISICITKVIALVPSHGGIPHLIQWVKVIDKRSLTALVRWHHFLSETDWFLASRPGWHTPALDEGQSNQEKERKMCFKLKHHKIETTRHLRQRCKCYVPHSTGVEAGNETRGCRRKAVLRSHLSLLLEVQDWSVVVLLLQLRSSLVELVGEKKKWEIKRF